PVQWVNRPSQDFRGFAGRVAAGVARPGDRVRVVPSGTVSKIKAIVAEAGDRPSVGRGESTLVTLEDEIDVSRGDVIAAENDAPAAADQFEAQLLWMHEHALIPGRPYLLKIHTKEVTATVTSLRHRLDVSNGAFLAAKTLALNEIGTVHLS